ncbi:MAG: GMC family oxidoreductase [Candidatus Nanopelagicales bacterium]
MSEDRTNSSGPQTPENDYDVLVIGSGFGGSVSALRLTEKGYRVGVLESGRRFADEEFAKTSWRVKDYLWAPELGCFGIQRIHRLDDVIVLAGAGVGGGSLVYANTLYVPGEGYFKDPHWAHITDWSAELLPFYDQAQRMLGVVTNPTMTAADVAFKSVADEMGVGHTFKMTPVGVYFGSTPGVTEADPYFGGVGPERTGCIECGECMTGCRHNAKNTLVKNYLGLAEGAGAVVHPLTTVTDVRPLPGGQWAVDTRATESLAAKAAGKVRRKVAGRTGGADTPADDGVRTFTAQHVVFSAGTWGTQSLLHKLRHDGQLPGLSPRLGALTRTNSESLVGVMEADPPGAADFTHGVAITSSFFPDPSTHIEPCRYGKGSNAMLMLGTVLSDGAEGVPRYKQWARAALAKPKDALASLWVRNGSERGIIALVMQNVNNSIVVTGDRTRSGRFRLRSSQGEGEPNPTWIPVANDAVRRLARIVNGRPMGNWGEVIDAPMTAHFIGGVVIGLTPQDGVIDPYHRVHGYPGLHVVDGSTITANVGVNPSLTITAMAERAMSLWPNAGEEDARPAQGLGYQRLAAVAPKNPVVPEHAPGALRLPVDLGMPPVPAAPAQ